MSYNSIRTSDILNNNGYYLVAVCIPVNSCIKYTIRFVTYDKSSVIICKDVNTLEDRLKFIGSSHYTSVNIMLASIKKRLHNLGLDVIEYRLYSENTEYGLGMIYNRKYE